MLLKILSDTAVRGVPHFQNDVVEIEDAEAKILLNYQRAEKYVETPEIEEIEEPEIDPEKPKIKKKRG